MNQEYMIQDIQSQLVQLFKVSTQLCLERGLELFKTNAKNVKIAEIVAACYSLAGNYDQAIKYYLICLEGERESPAYYNNLAWNKIGKSQFLQAATYLNDIKQKWNHPAIYMNLGTAYQRCGVGQSIQLIDQTLGKKQEYRSNYPDFQQEDKRGLIHTFLLTQRQNYSTRVWEFKAHLLDCVRTLQNVPRNGFEFTFLHSTIQQMLPRIAQRTAQETQYGIVLQNKQKAYIQVIRALEQIILRKYVQEYRQKMDGFITQAIRLLNQNIFNLQISQDIDYTLLLTNAIKPCLHQLAQIGQAMSQMTTQLDLAKQVQAKLNKERQIQLNRDRQITAQESHMNHKYQRPPMNFAEQEYYQYMVRIRDIEDVMQKQKQDLVQTLRVEKENQANPLFWIVKYKRFNYCITNVYLNRNRIDRQLSDAPLCIQACLLTVNNPNQRNQLLKYYHALNLLLRFYNYYATNNFQYKTQNINTNIQLNHFIQLITPILNQFFQDDRRFSKIGWLCNETHFSIVKYLTETTALGSYKQAQNKMLRNINSIIKENQNAAASILMDVLSPKCKQYFDVILSHQLLNVDHSTKYHMYFNWKVNRFHNLHPEKQLRLAFNQQDDSVISNLVLQFATLAEKEFNKNRQNLLFQAFVQCYYTSRVREPHRNVILRKYFQANHDIPRMQKISIAIRKIMRKVFL